MTVEEVEIGRWAGSGKGEGLGEGIRRRNPEKGTRNPEKGSGVGIRRGAQAEALASCDSYGEIGAGDVHRAI